MRVTIFILRNRKETKYISVVSIVNMFLFP